MREGKRANDEKVTDQPRGENAMLTSIQQSHCNVMETRVGKG